MKKITTKALKKSTKKVAEEITSVISPQKSKSKKINLPLIISIVVIAILAFLYYRFGIVATVNGRPISRFAYIQALERQDQKQTIKQMANEALVYQEAAKKGIVIEQSVIDTEIASIEAQIKEQGLTLDSALQSEGMTKSELISQIRLQKIIEKLANPNLEIDQAKIDEFLKTNKASLPSSYTKEELQNLAKTQLTSQIKNEAISAWFSELSKSAKIVIR